MSKSFGEALSQGIPIVLLRKGDCPEVIGEPGKEPEALDTLDKMKIVKLTRPQDGRKPKGAIQNFSEKPVLTDEELLEEYGWEMECLSPFELRHKDGSFLCGNQAKDLLRQYREDEKK